MSSSTFNLETLEAQATNNLQADDQQQPQPPKRHINWWVLLLYITFNAVGAVGGPLLQRLYYIHGGSRKWLCSCLQSIGFPFLLVPISFLYVKNHAAAGGGSSSKGFFMGLKLAIPGALLGLLVGLDNFMYSVGLASIPVSTSALLFSTQLAFTATFAFLIVKQRFTFYSLNAVVLMTLGAVVLALHSSRDRPVGVSRREYLVGFLLTLGGAALIGCVLPLVELSYRKACEVITCSVAMQYQFVFSGSSALFCLVGMAINNDFQAIPREAKVFELGEVQYYAVLVASAIIWQFLFLGSLGIIYCTSSLFAGVVSALLLPLTPIAAVIAFNEKFTGEKGLSLALCLWGFTSYFLGEYKKTAKKEPITDKQEVMPYQSPPL